MNRLQLREGVYDECGVLQTDAQLTTATVDRFVNVALHEIESEHDWPWYQTSATITTAAGTGSYAVPTDWSRTRYLRIDQYREMEMFEIGDLENRWTSAATQGQPTEYAIDGDQVVLRPIPDTAYTVTHRYIKRESDLTADDQSPLMPSTFHPAIVYLAAHYALLRIREEQRAAAALASYQRWEQKMASHRRRVAGTGHVKIRPYEWV